MRSATRLIVISALLFSVTIPAYGQDLAGLEQGIKPYGAYHGGDIDSISMSNGNLTLHIPLVSYPQRGGRLHMGYSIIYTNPVYSLTWTPAVTQNHDCSAEGCYVWALSTRGGSAGGGTSVRLKPDMPSISNVMVCVVNPCLLYNYKVVESDGAAHQMGTSGTNWISMDTTGYTYNPTTPVMTDRRGTQYFGTPTTVIEDTNGNKITGNLDPNNSAQVDSWTDTIGRVLPNYPQEASSTSGCPNGGLAGNGLLAASTAFIWSLPVPNGTTATFLVCYAAFPLSYTSICNGYSSCAGLGGDNYQVQSIVLPNGTAWNFAFDTTGALSQITLPTGGTISYTWGQDYYCMPAATEATVSQFTANALSRTVNANDGSGPHTWNYSLTPTSSGSGQTVQTIVTDPYSNDALHTLTPMAPSGQTTCSLYETDLKEYSGSHTSGTLLRETSTSYSSSGLYTPPTGSGPDIALNVVPVSITTTDVPAGKSSQVTKSWDSGVALTGDWAGIGNALYGDLLIQSENDFSGTNLRTTTNSYMALSGPNASSYLANNLLDLPYTVQVTGTSGRSYTTYGYDESTLVSSGISEQKIRGESYPGNQTSVHRSLNTNTAGTSTCNAISNGYAVTTNVFYNTGMVQKVTDPCGNSTTYQYSNTYYGAYITTVTNALSQSTNYLYDFNSGSVISIQDPNSQTTTKTYDIMDRLLSVGYPDGGSTTYCYTDGVASACTGGNTGSAAFAVVETKKITSSLNEISTATLDGLARLSQTQLNSDPSGTTYTDTTYDAIGRKYQVYNPTRCSSITSSTCSNSETTWGRTTYTYDPLNRVTQVTEPDGSSVTTTYDQTISNNSNNTGVCSTVTDEVGNQRQSCVDALGRLEGVFEDPAHSNYETDYAYDALNNLLSVNQKGSNSSNARGRSFQYDSLSRLLSASNPESGNISYTYDADGNVLSKSAPMPDLPTGNGSVTTNYQYDALNRLTIKTYSGMTMPTILFGYDGVAPSGCTPPTLTDPYPIGRRTSMCDGSGATSWAHDQMGRVATLPAATTPSQAQLQATSSSTSVTESTTYKYNLDGSLNTVTYPSGNIVTYTPGGAGRPLSAYDSANNYVTSATYAPQGALATMTNGYTSSFAGIVTSNIYNDRLQPILLSASVSSNPIFSLCYDFHLGVSVSSGPCSLNAYSIGDNGNVFQIINNVNSTRSAAFYYDYLNRISQANTTNTTSDNCWGEVYTVDSWGNLTNISGQSSMPDCYTESLNNPVGTNNQVTGFCYDGAGNLMDPSACPSSNTHAYVYDAEGQLLSPPSVTQSPGGCAAGGGCVQTTSSWTYFYDGDGDRVQKCDANPCTSASTAGTLYWREPDGETLDESDRSGNMQEEYVFFNGQRIARRDVAAGGAGSSSGATSSTVHYYFSNRLGSASVITDSSGNIELQEDFYPYGGVAYTNGSDSNHYMFTGKERDAESGLDNFGARYNASSLGRFMSPDPMGGHYGDPQTLNRYAYVRNNPLRFTDPTGLDFYLTCTQTSDTCQGGHVGTTTTTTDANGNTTSTFTPTVVTSASLQDPNSGNTATVNGNGVQITTAQGTFGGEFISNTPAANGIQGSGALAGFTFDVNGNCGGSCLASGSFQFNGSGDQARALLATRGAWSYWMMDALDSTDFGFHPETDQFRFGSGPSSHLSVPWNDVMRPDYSRSMTGINGVEGDSGFVLRAVHNPKSTVPINGDFHVDKATGLGHARDAFCSVVGCN